MLTILAVRPGSPPGNALVGKPGPAEPPYTGGYQAGNLVTWPTPVMKLFSALTQRAHAPLAPPAPQDTSLISRIGRWLQGLRQALVQRFTTVQAAPRPLDARHPQVSSREALPNAPPPSLRTVSGAAGVQSAFDLMLQDVTRPGQALGRQLQMLGEVEAGLRLNQAIDEPARLASLARLAQVREGIEPDAATLEKTAAQATQGLTLDNLAAELPKRRQKISELSEALAHIRRLDAPARQALATRLEETQQRLAILENRRDDLKALQVEAPRMGQALAQLPMAHYIDARRSLIRVLARMPEAPRHLVLQRLDDMIRDTASVRWLEDMAAGDFGIIDMVFQGAQWNEDALALKQATVPPGDMKAQLNLDAQHNLRMVSQELDGFMASRNVEKGRAHLPVSLFGAVKADARVIGWLTEYASEEVESRNAQIGAWISLSLHDEKTGEVNKNDVDTLLALLQKKGMNPALLREHIRAGFSNTAEVVECRELMEKVARACQESALLGSLDEKRFPALQAARVARDLIQEVTGRPTETATGDAVDEALAEAAEQAMPWVRFEQDLLLARRALADQMRGISTAPFVIEGHASADRRWLADPAALEAAQPDHERVRAILYNDERLKAIQTRQSTVVDPAERSRLSQEMAELSAEMAEHREALAGFSAAHLRREPGSRLEPSLADLRAIGVEMEALTRLPTLHQRVAMLQPLALPKDDQQRKQADLLLERLRQIATLQVGLLSENPDFAANGIAPEREGYTGQILKRLEAFGISSRRPSAFIKEAVNRSASNLSQDNRTLRQLVDKLDPRALQARVTRAVRGMSGGKRGSLTLTLTPAAPAALAQTEGQRRQRLAADSVERQVRELAQGQSFDIRMGVYGTVSVGTPVVPGLSVQTDARAERQHGIRVSLQDDGAYVVRVQGGGAVRHGVTLSALSDLLTFRGESQLASEKGFDLRFDNREECLSMLRGLITGGEVDPAVWAPAGVQRIERREVAGRANLSAGAQLTLASLSAEVAAAVGSTHEVLRTSSGEVEIQGRRLQAGATLSAAAANGAQKEGRLGVDLGARKELHRQFGMIRPESQLTLSATVTGGNVAGCVQSLLPDLPDADHKALRDAMLGSLQGNVPEGTEVFVRYRLTPAALREANALLGQASAALTQASLARGEPRQLALDEARTQARAAHAVTQRTSSYAFDGWGQTRSSFNEVSRHRGAYQQFARGQSAQTEQGAAVTEVQGAALGGLSPALAALIP